MRVGERVARRRFLALLAAACAGFAGTTVWPRTRPETLPGDAALIRAVLAGLFSDLRSVRAIGVAYLRISPDAATASEQSMAAILGEGTETLSAAELRRIVSAQMRKDFAVGAIVSIDGWMLSRTEVRLCALATLADPPIVRLGADRHPVHLA